MEAIASPARTKRTPLWLLAALELLPLIALVGLSLLYVVALLAAESEYADVVDTAIALPFTLLFFAYFVAGIGWIETGRIGAGCALGALRALTFVAGLVLVLHRGVWCDRGCEAGADAYLGLAFIAGSLVGPVASAVALVMFERRARARVAIPRAQP